MNKNDVLEKLKLMLFGEEKPNNHSFSATKVLEDGTELYTEGEFVVGEKVQVITEEGLVDAPSGEHKTNDGFIVSVDENSVIVEIKPQEEELPQPEQMEGNPEDMVIVNETTENELVEAIVEAIKPLMEEIVELKKQFSEQKETIEKLSKSPAGNPIKFSEESGTKSTFEKRLEILSQFKKD